jgi:hypothetical protein
LTLEPGVQFGESKEGPHAEDGGGIGRGHILSPFTNKCTCGFSRKIMNGVKKYIGNMHLSSLIISPPIS